MSDWQNRFAVLSVPSEPPPQSPAASTHWPVHLHTEPACAGRPLTPLQREVRGRPQGLVPLLRGAGGHKENVFLVFVGGGRENRAYCEDLKGPE